MSVCGVHACTRACERIFVFPGVGTVRDPTIVTTLTTAPDGQWYASAAVDVVFIASVANLDTDTPVSGHIVFAIPELNVIHRSALVNIPAAATWIDVKLPSLSLAAVELWWPHNLGPPRLYNASVTFVVVGDTTPSDVVHARVGFRSVSSVVDDTLGV
jgi:hypothetical protein